MEKLTKYAGTQTEKNLEAAFAGESQARNKYTFFASVAKKQGFEQIASLFLKTADNEKEHAKMWFKELNGIGDTAQNLLAAAEGTNGQTCMTNLQRQQRKKDSRNLQQNSVLWVKSKDIMKKDTAHCLQMLKRHRYLQRVKLRCGNAETADIS